MSKDRAGRPSSTSEVERAVRGGGISDPASRAVQDLDLHA
jgi:hypothetical protein